MELSRFIGDELRGGRLAGRDLSEGLQAALDRHCAELMVLVASLEGNGTDGKMIRELVTALVRSYENDLIQILETDDENSPSP